MKGKFIKKLTACALAAAMVITTPVTASAAEFKDFFWISDGNPEHDEESQGYSNPTGTGTVTSTNSDTTTLEENASNIKGIKISPARVELNVTNGPDSSKTLKAEILYEDENALDAAAKKEIEKHISWKSSNLNIVRPAAKYWDRATCPITGYKGGFATITAYLDVDGDKVADFEARTSVIVKKQVTDFSFNENKEFYAGHTYDLMDYIDFTPADAFDEFTFEPQNLDKKNQKLVTLNDGVLKVGKVTDKNQFDLILKATPQETPEKAKNITVKIRPGVPVTGWEKVGKQAVDIANEYSGDTRTIKHNDVSVTPKTKGGTTTDDITWTSSNPQVVRVEIPSGKTGNTEKDGAPLTAVKYVAVAPGKAQIVATATSGKSVKINVTVTATLKEIKSASVKTTYTGKATAVEVVKIPAENQDKLKVKLPKGTKNLKAKAAITPILTPGVDLSKISGTENSDGSKTISGITLESPKKITSPEFSITINQSDVKLDKVVTAKAATADLNKKTVKLNPGRIATYFAVLDLNHTNVPGLEAVSWESSKETVATVDGGRVKVVGEGTAKITASAVYKDTNKNKYVTIKKAFTVKATPKCEQIIFKVNRVTPKANAKKVVVNISQQVPKKANDTITWYVLKDSQLIALSSGIDGDKADKKNGMDNKKCTLTSAQLNEYKENGVVTVIAKTGTVEAQAKIVWP